MLLLQKSRNMWTQAATDSLASVIVQCIRTRQQGTALAFSPTGGKDYKTALLLTASIRPFRDGVFNISASKTSSDSFRTYSNTEKQIGQRNLLHNCSSKPIYI